MKKWRKDSDDASALRVTLAVALLFAVAVLFAFPFAGSPIAQSGVEGLGEGTQKLTRGNDPLTPPPPSCTDNTWRDTNIASAPPARSGHTAVWTGTEMIVWGGSVWSGYSNTGARYNPVTDSWTPTSTSGAPNSRESHVAVWTGSEMIVWGGRSGSNTGKRYNPQTDTWTTMSTLNAPSPRYNFAAVWTGTEMIVWGGENGTGCCPEGCCAINTGGRYNPVTDAWTPTDALTAPPARAGFPAVWTGTEMIVWGGGGGGISGGRYNPVTNSWTPTSTENAPAHQILPTAVWTGSEMIVWGGATGTSIGGRYNPATDTWVQTSAVNAPIGRYLHTAIWDGEEMIVWGGFLPPNVFMTGGRYNPVNDTWTATATTAAPIGRIYHSAVWTGHEMIVWGGGEDAKIPPTPTSAPDPLQNKPVLRRSATTTTSASDSVIDQPLGIILSNTGGRYCATGLPTATPTPPLPGPTVSLPIDTISNQVPVDTVLLKPITTTNINPSLQYLGFQADFTFDEGVITFASPFVEPAGLTGSNWNVSGHIIPGTGPVRILRVSAFSNDFTPMNGSGVLYNLRMVRVSGEPQRSTPLSWRPFPDNFYFIDEKFNKNVVAQIDGFITIIGTGPTATPTPPPPTPTPSLTPTPTPTLTPVPTVCGTFSNSSPIAIPASGSNGIASPYPSNITVSGLGGTITRVAVAINGINHAFPKDIDVLLVGPGGQNAIIMSDVGGYAPVSNINLVLEDAAYRPLPNGGPLISGSFRPTNILDCVEPETDPFPMPAPTPSGASAALSIFNGTNPNGTWRLYVLDDSGLNQGGNFSEGWAITLETGNCGGPTPTPTPTIGPPRFSISVPGSVVQGIPFNFTVTANNIPNYTGTVHFTSSDSGANLPGDSTLSGGTGTFQATINNGVWFHDQTITATDTSDLSITGTSNCIFINKQTPCPGCGTPTPTPSPNCSPSIEGFNNVATLPPSWYMQNNSQPGPGTTNWFQGNSDAFPAQGGAATSYIGANFNNGTGTSTLSNWLLTPPVSLRNGVVLTFWTRTVDTPAFPDRLQVRMSTNGSSANVGTTATSVGDFTNLLLDINPTYTTTGYPNIWTQFSVTVSGIPSPTLGRLAFRYFVENGGPNGTNSDYIGIDTLSLDGLPCPCATPSFSNSAPITIPGSGTSGIAAPYPSTITVTGVASPIRKVEVTLRGLNHTSPRDIDILLVGPHGQNAIIMSDAGSYHPVAADLFLMDYSEDPAPPMFPPYPMPNGGPMFSGNYLPTNYVSCEEGAADIFPAPAPIPSGAVSLSTFNAADPNGTWSLYVVDDKEGGAGSFSGGWDLKIYPASCPQATPIGTCCPSPPPTHFQIIAPASVNPGVPFSFTVTADGQVGTIHFTSSDPLAVLPNDSGLVGGTGTFSATLNQISSLETITATDIGNFHSTGISNCIATGSSTPTPSPTPTPCTPVGIQERFDDIATLVSRGWFMQNNSQPGPGTTGWFQGDSRVFPSFYSFPKTSYLAADFNNGTGTSTLSNWLLTPPLTLENGLLMTFWMKTVLTPSFPDRLQVRLSTNGASTNVGTSATDVGDFSRLLLDTNPPIAWTPFTVTVTGLASSTTGRLALRYFVENGGPSGSNSDYIGIDQMQIAGPCPPTPTPTAKPTPTSSPPPPVSIDPGWGPFGSKIVGSSSPSIQFKVFVTRPQTVSVSLSDTTNFSITEDTCSSASGNPCFVAVKFNPYTAGPKVASLTVNDTYGTAIVSLTGTGRPLTATPAPTPSGTPSPTPTPARALNLSTRLRVETGNNVGVGGFIITGTAPRQVLLRGIGPSLVGVGQPLADPVLELHGPNGFVTVTNNNWRDNQETEIIATGIPPTNDLESAILATLDPGAYTAILSGNENGTGTGLVEIYDLSQGTDSNLANISTRAFVSTGSDIVIAGFILGGGTNDDRILVRGIGPSLTGAGVPNALVNPTLELRNGEGALVAANDDWQNGPPVSLPPSDSSESAIELTLSPGAYTALLFGVNNGTGVGLVEVYDLGLP